MLPVLAVVGLFQTSQSATPPRGSDTPHGDPARMTTAVRATGMGWAIGIGRLGAILAPLASGALLDRGWEAQQLYGLFSGPFAIAAMAMLLVGSRSALTATVTVPSAPR